MTRFDEALTTFADASEGEMAARVTANQHAFATIVEVDRKRSRRLASQVAAVVGVVALGAAAWSLAGGTPDAPPAGVPLTDASFVCGEPFAIEASGDPSADGVGPSEHRLMVPGAAGLERLDFDGDAPTFISEAGLEAWFATAYPADYKYATATTGLDTFAVLVDSGGRIAAKTTSTGEADELRWGVFEPDSCSVEPLDGTYEVHMVSRSWVGDPSQVEYTWVDEGLPPGASITIDPSEGDRLAELASTVQQAFVDGGWSLASVTGPAVIQYVSPCAVADAIADAGLESVPAFPESALRVDATLGVGELVTPYYAEDEWWESLDSYLFFIDANGGFAGLTGVTGASQASDGEHTVTTFGDTRLCDDMGLPTASGTYNAFLYVPQPDVPANEAPEALRSLGGYEHTAAWVPVGTLVNP